MAAPNSGIRYPMAHQVQASAPMEQLGLQQQIPANHVPFSTAQHQPQTVKQERPKSKKVIIRDPNQGGKDITNEILSRKRTGPPAAAAATATAATTNTAQPTSQESAIREKFMTKVTERKNDKNFVSSEPDAKVLKDTEKDRELKERTAILPEEIPSQINEVKPTTDVSDDKESSHSANMENSSIEKELPVPDTSSVPSDSTETVTVNDADRDVQIEPSVVSEKGVEVNAIDTIDNEDTVPSDESNGKEDEPAEADAIPAEVGEEKVLQKELEPLEVMENETFMLNETSDANKEDEVEGTGEPNGDENSSSDMISNDNANEDDANAGLMLNGLEKPIQSVPVQGRSM